jgi:hypothetical protein
MAEEASTVVAAWRILVGGLNLRGSTDERWIAVEVGAQTFSEPPAHGCEGAMSQCEYGLDVVESAADELWPRRKSRVQEEDRGTRAAGRG